MTRDSKEYVEYSFEDNEEAFEREIIKHAKEIFGEKTIYIDTKKLLKSNKKQEGTIPDGYLLDFTFENTPRLYLVENEVRNHSINKHIAPQIGSFYLNYDNSINKIKEIITQYLNKENISIDKYLKKTEYRNIDDMLTKQKLGVIVVIDDADERLYELKNMYRFDLEIIVFKKFVSKDKDIIFLFDKFNAQEDVPRNLNNSEELDTVIVSALEDGFKNEFIMNNRWFAVSIGINKLAHLKYIAVYQTSPVRAITHYAEIDNFEPFNDTGKYLINFRGRAKKLKNPIPLNPNNPRKAPQGRVYTNINRILNANSKTTLDDIY